MTLSCLFKEMKIQPQYAVRSGISLLKTTMVITDARYLYSIANNNLTLFLLSKNLLSGKQVHKYKGGFTGHLFWTVKAAFLKTGKQIHI